MCKKGKQTYLKIGKKWQLQRLTQSLEDMHKNKPRTKKYKDMIMEYSRTVLRKYNPRYRK